MPIDTANIVKKRSAVQVAAEQAGNHESECRSAAAAPGQSSSEAPGESRVSWQFRSGASGFVDCSSPEAARLIVADLRPDSRVWVGGQLVQDGWPEA